MGKVARETLLCPRGLRKAEKPCTGTRRLGFLSQRDCSKQAAGALGRCRSAVPLVRSLCRDWSVTSGRRGGAGRPSRVQRPRCQPSHGRQGGPSPWPSVWPLGTAPAGLQTVRRQVGVRQAVKMRFGEGGEQRGRRARCHVGAGQAAGAAVPGALLGSGQRGSVRGSEKLPPSSPLEGRLWGRFSAEQWRVLSQETSAI